MKTIATALASSLLTATVLAGLWWHAVPTDPTAEDRLAVHHILAPTYQDEIAMIALVQARVLAASPLAAGIPKGQPREPADLLRAGGGLCFDRSRAIEKALAALGFQTRHIALYRDLEALVLPGVGSHALTEVRTAEGWLLVDSVSPWLGLDEAGQPVSAARARLGDVRWGMPLPTSGGTELLARPGFLFVRGLYSRHGQFFPPYWPFPDIAWRDFLWLGGH